MRRLILSMAFLILVIANLAFAAGPVKALGVHFGLFSPADWRVQDIYVYGQYNRYISPGNGREIDGTIALIYDHWRFHLESGYRW